ncbi:Fur family transcriptional regulator [Parvularcula maris]|uniref:Ferric uptake regulation protein n=1 Tax=Parvularcula maris TaxID=2965077 RepID=A0A9X2L6Q1_9PROT|nr:hypothetical protein [Parvularcula maris]MCQ8184088.1 hypothetical protein [Parvularcula maris]
MSHTAAVAQDRPVSMRPRMTRNDRAVLGCLEDLARPMKAYELLECLREHGINAPMTVYRALARLTDRGLVRKIESLNAYYALPGEARGECAAFLICRHCEALSFRKVDAAAVSGLVGDLDISDAYIELTTDCLSEESVLLSGGCRKQ